MPNASRPLSSLQPLALIVKNDGAIKHFRRKTPSVRCISPFRAPKDTITISGVQSRSVEWNRTEIVAGMISRYIEGDRLCSNTQGVLLLHSNNHKAHALITLCCASLAERGAGLNP